LLGAYYNDSISLLKSFKNILIIGNSKLRQIDDVLEAEVSSQELNEAVADIGNEFLGFRQVLLEFKTTWIEEHRKTTLEVIK
jgi:urease accessory protein UreF